MNHPQGLWRFNGSVWATVDWHRVFTPGTCIICGSGMGLTDYVPDPKNFHICINAAWKIVRPDIWVGMDSPAYFGKELMDQMFRKVLKGGSQEDLVDGFKVQSYPETYFPSDAEVPLENVMLDRRAEPTFVWQKNSFIPAIQLAVWMGFRRIGFAGVNLGGSHCDGRVFTKEQKADYAILWKEIECDLRALHHLGSQLGIVMVSYTKDSPINTFMQNGLVNPKD